jgi:hypothetical protein
MASEDRQSVVNNELSRFISSSFPSVWALELLLLLKSERRPWSRGELIGALRASELVVSQSLDSLVAGGLASVTEEEALVHAGLGSVAKLVDQAEICTHSSLTRFGG